MALCGLGSNGHYAVGLHARTAFCGCLGALLLLLLAAQPSSAIEDIPPVFMVYEGCSMSSSTYHVAFAMMEAHGHPVMKSGMEQLKIKNNKMASMSRGLHTIDKFMDAAIVSAKFHDQIYFSKMENSVWKFPNSFLNVLKFHKARFVSTYRENVLDLLVCRIKDCFPGASAHGHPVTDDGKRDSLCMDRRKPGSPHTMAYINVKQLPAALRNLSQRRQLQNRRLRTMGVKGFNTVSTEALMAFGFSSERMDESVKAWSSFLESVGVKPHEWVIRKVLEGEQVGAMSGIACGKGYHNACKLGGHPLKWHTETIYNYGEVERALQRINGGAYMKFLRHNNSVGEWSGELP